MGAVSQDGKHILILEDDELASGALRLLFTETGRRVTLAARVADAVRLASDDPPALMLLDLTLPDGDGMEVLHQLRAADRPIGLAVALTGRDDPETEARCRAAGCVDVMVKPVPIRTLLQRAAELLDHGAR